MVILDFNDIFTANLEMEEMPRTGPEVHEQPPHMKNSHTCNEVQIANL